MEIYVSSPNLFSKKYIYIFLLDFQNYPIYLDLCNYLMILIFFYKLRGLLDLRFGTDVLWHMALHNLRLYKQ